MRFSIIIPTYNNFKYYKLTIESIKKNSIFNHEIITHINGLDNDTKKYLLDNNHKFTESDKNIGLCSGVNRASKLATTEYILYSHDDMYFLPKWDIYLIDEINKIKNNNFYLSLTQISHKTGYKNNLQHIHFDCGSTLENFDENKLLKNFEIFEFRELQGSHWAPHIIHKDSWNKAGGFSEEFNPGFASDPDLNMKLWKIGTRIFKGVPKSRVYHFGSVTTRKNINIKRNEGKKTFLLKWKISVEFFVKHYLRRGTSYDGPLKEPSKNFFFFIDLIFCKIKYYLSKV
jgi:GT2 family glycosyltransferase